MKKLGFTLAEVLITLVIIGIVAVLTVPSLTQNSYADEYRAGLKKAISGLNQALTQHYALEGLSAQDYTSSEDIVENILKKRMNVVENNSNFKPTGCTASTAATFTTADGIVFCISAFHSDDTDDQDSACNSYNSTGCVSSANLANPAPAANIWIDVNGMKKPNKMTTSSSRPKDVYTAVIYAQKAVPYGEATQSVLYNRGIYQKN